MAWRRAVLQRCFLGAALHHHAGTSFILHLGLLLVYVWASAWPIPHSHPLRLSQYPKISGGHAPSNGGHVTDSVKQLAHIHGQGGTFAIPLSAVGPGQFTDATLFRPGWVHGDLRLFNTLFLANPIAEAPGQQRGDTTVVFLDFDFAGPLEGNPTYPPNYSRDIDDGGRHADAGEGRPILPRHDWFGLGQALGKCLTPNMRGVADTIGAGPTEGEALARFVERVTVAAAGIRDEHFSATAADAALFGTPSNREAR